MGFTLPPRTSVDMTARFELPEELKPGGNEISADMQPTSFACIDCDYKTTDVESMSEHQKFQARYHTRRQRVRRWLKVATRS